MKKGVSIFLRVLAVVMIIIGIICLGFGAFGSFETAEVKNMSDISAYGVADYTVLYFEELEVLERYAFKTEYEYRDSEGTYEETDYFVYDASQPMDDNELFAEYYIVKFSDNTGKEFVTSLCVRMDKSHKPDLATLPAQISCCAYVATISDNALANSYDVELANLRRAAINEYSGKTGASAASVALEYKTHSVSQYQQDAESDNQTTRVLMIVFGVLLVVGAVLILRLVKRKKNSV